MEASMNNDKDKLQMEINELSKKYEALLKDVKCLEDSKNSMKNIVENSYEVVQNVSKNVENVMNDLNNMKNDYKNNVTSNIKNDEKMKFPMKEMFINPLRKIAIGTMQTAFLMMDKTVEGMSNAKEGFEDIVAEAQYQNKKKRLETNEER